MDVCLFDETQVQYKTEKNGVIETRLEQLTSFDETDIDHDLVSM